MSLDEIQLELTKDFLPTDRILGKKDESWNEILDGKDIPLEGYHKSIRNTEFLNGVFREELKDVRPILVSFGGNPSSVQKNAWGGHVWHPDTEELSGMNNNYFSLSVFRPDEAGYYRRQKKHFVGLYAIMLDDVGTKISLGRVTLSPSWQIETSSGNFQFGYILKTPIIDAATADRLMDSIVVAGLCDPGAKGPTARLARLPVAINGKHTPPFTCRLTEWQPELRYSIDELIDGLELDFKGKEHTKKKKKPHENLKNSQENVFIPCPTENPVIETFHKQGLYKKPLGNGKHDITCPWVTEHTDGIDNGTAYFEPADKRSVGGFKCLHGHCAERHIKDLLQYLGIEPKSARMKNTIRVVGGAIHHIVDLAEKELANSGKYYQRGGLIVNIITDPGTNETRIQESNQSNLVEALAESSEWEKFDKRSGEWVTIDPPTRHVNVLYDSQIYSHLPILRGLARQPYFRPDGTLSLNHGYDAATGLFGVFSSNKFIIPKKPTKADAQKALHPK